MRTQTQLFFVYDIVYVHISNLRMCVCLRVCTGACDCVFLNVEGEEGGGGGEYDDEKRPATAKSKCSASTGKQP